MRTIILIISTVLLSCMPVPVNSGRDEYMQALKLVDQGVRFLRLGELDRADASFKVATELAQLASAVDGLGCVAMMRGNWLRAEELFNQAYNMDKSYYNSLGNLALLYEKRGDPQKARKLYAQALRTNPQNFQLRNNYAVFLDRQGEREAAVIELAKAQALKEHPLVQQNLMRLKV